MATRVPRVLIIGYSPDLSGGVVKVTETLRNAYPNMDLHVFHHRYAPKLKAVTQYIMSLLGFLVRLHRIRESYDVLHIIVGSSGDAVRTLPYLWLAKLCGVASCIQHHKSSDIVFDNMPRFLPDSWVKSTWRLPTAHVFLSERLKSNFEQVVYKRSGLHIIPNAVPDEWLQPSTTGGFHDRTREVVFFGRWSWEKGVNDLVKASNSLEGKFLFECYTNVGKPTTEGACRLYPWVEEREVREIIKSSRLLILPSYSEAFPTVLLEACACGTPFVASDVAGIPDIAEASEAGVTFPAGDVNGMTTLIEKILGDKEHWEKMSIRGKRWVQSLSPQAIQRQWVDLYKALTK